MNDIFYWTRTPGAIPPEGTLALDVSLTILHLSFRWFDLHILPLSLDRDYNYNKFFLS